MVTSPLSGKPSKLLRKVDLDKLVKDYAYSFGIDILPLIFKCKSLALYEDEENSYRFFYPFDVVGDDKFYQSLQKFDWYYMPWKWEHEISLNYIKPNQQVLEVGCGSGGFIKKISSIIGKKNINGLELNSEEVYKLQSEGYDVYDTDLKEFAKYNKERFDLVCSYQVLEHIADVKAFIKAKIDCLKSGGELLISVPNNDSTLLKVNYGGALNHPPHHLGLWNKESLKALENLFPVKLKKLYFEPLQEYHWDWYLSLIDIKLKNSYLNKLFVLKPSFKNYFYFFLKKMKPAIKGHTIVAVYKKV